MIKFASVKIDDKVYIWDREIERAEPAIVVGLFAGPRLIRVRVVSTSDEPLLTCNDVSATEQGASPVTQAWVDRLLDKALDDGVEYVLTTSPQVVAFDMVMCIDECQHHAPIEFEPFIRDWQRRKMAHR